jgi:DNA 3'-phosphatase
MAQNWTLREDSVYYLPGAVRSNKIAAFDLGNTLIWSDSGGDMTKVMDWVPTTSPNKLISALADLIQDDWTIVIFSNHLAIRPIGLQRIMYFIRKFQTELLQQFRLVIFEPSVYIATRNDEYYKPRRGMWDMFMEDTILLPSPASFYCGDEAGPEATNPLYRIDYHDIRFAQAIRSTYYTPDEILGVYEPPPIDFTNIKIIVIMAAHKVQYEDYIAQFRQQQPRFEMETLEEATKRLDGPGWLNNNIIIWARVRPQDDPTVSDYETGDRFETWTAREELRARLSPEYRDHTIILMFTRPVLPFRRGHRFRSVTEGVQQYADALDVHPIFETEIPAGTNGEPFRIVRIN